MREILFRGKRVDNREWEQGGILQENDYVAIAVYSDYHEWHEWELVIPETVGQYTGLKDMSGKKMFEGDIVKDEYGRIMSVVWKWNRLVFKLLRYKEKWTNNFTYADLKQWFDDSCPFPEVIGNIHDNPELLDEKE